MSNWINKYSSYLSIPDNWESLNDFANWYIDNKMPIIIPEDSHVYYTELVSSYVMFKHRTFQEFPPNILIASIWPITFPISFIPSIVRLMNPPDENK